MAEDKKIATRRSPGFEGAKAVIGKAIHSLGKGKERKFYAHLVLWHWQDIVGEYIAANCKPQGIRKQVLYLSCSNSALSNELIFMQERLIGEINEFAGMEMVKEIHFTRPWEHPESEGIDAIRLAQAKKPLDIGAERRQMPLSPTEMQRADELGRQAKDEEIGAAVQKIYRKHVQMQKLRQKHGWHPCAACGRLTEPGATLCIACELKRRQRVVSGIRGVLKDIPWARCGEVREYVPECTPALLNHQRAILVQQLAAEVELTDIHSIKAKTLVMLYRCLPPEQLNEDVMRRALYDLRNNLHKPKNYKTPKRYDVIPLGKRHKGAK